jgi:hypothetical protein
MPSDKPTLGQQDRAVENEPEQRKGHDAGVNVGDLKHVRHLDLMFDPVQAPSLRHAFELVNAAVLETDFRLRHQVLDRA